jgi:carboxyl-terminal processing protease
MKILRRLFTTVLASLIQAWLMTACAATEPPATLSEEQTRLNLESFDVVWTTVRDRHFDPELGGLDWEAVRAESRPRVEQAETMAQARGAMIEMLDRLGHSHVAILPVEVLNAMAAPPQRGGAMGVTGLDLRVIDGHPLVTAVAAGSPAAEAGVEVGWELLRVGDQPLEPLLASVAREFEGATAQRLVLTEVVRSRLVGPIGETVEALFRDGDDREVALRLDHGEEQGIRFDLGHLSGLYVKVESRRIEPDAGYISLNKFMHPAVVMPAFEKAIRSFEKTKGLIIDIRGNPGGIIGVAMGIAGWLIDEERHYLGKLVLHETELKAIVFPRAEAYGGRVAILVDGLSGSTSEIFAAGLQDLGRARVFGMRTAGAALPSEIVKLPNGDGFQYVVADYVSAAGGHLEGVGVIPDEPVEPTREALLAGRDPALEAALAWIRAE